MAKKKDEKVRFITKPPIDSIKVRFSQVTQKRELPGGVTQEQKVRPRPITITDAGTEVSESEAEMLRSHPRYDREFVEAAGVKQSEEAARKLAPDALREEKAKEVERESAEAEALLKEAATRAEKAAKAREALAAELGEADREAHPEYYEAAGDKDRQEADAKERDERDEAVREAREEANEAAAKLAEAQNTVPAPTEKGGAGHRYDDIRTKAGAAQVLVNDHKLDIEDLKNKDGSLSITRIKEAGAKVGAAFSNL